MNAKTYKGCLVSQCTNTSVKTPEKLFIYVPNKPDVRRKWLKLAGRDENLSTSSSTYFCEDHFDLPNDMENYVRYKLMGSVKKIRMKPNCLPSKFDWQLKLLDPKKRTPTSIGSTRPIAKKTKRLGVMPRKKREHNWVRLKYGKIALRIASVKKKLQRKDKVAPVSTNECLPAKMDEASIIVLDDDDLQESASKKPKISGKCINYLCKSGVDLFEPPVFCLSYYRVKNTNSKQMVCQECYEIALDHFGEICERLQNSECLMTSQDPIRDEVFALDDSDEEDDGKTEKKETYIDESTMNVLAENFDDVLLETLQSIDLSTVVSKSITLMNERLKSNEESCVELQKMVDTIRKDVDSSLMSLFGELKIENVSLGELIINDGNEQFETDSRKLPALGMQKIDFSELPPPDLPKREPVVKPAIAVGGKYFAKRNETGGSWVRVVLENILPPGSKLNGKQIIGTMYQVLREKTANAPNQSLRKFVNGKELAYSKSLDAVLEVGARVVALFHTDDQQKGGSHYPGIVGEFPSAFNKYRYLIFFDDGYAQYVHYKNVFMVYESSREVWNDVNPESRNFIKKYLTLYPSRSMVQLTKNQYIRTEYKGKWYNTLILDVDCSLVQIFFDTFNLKEWIYRGSRRLNIMYEEQKAASNRLQHKQRNHRLVPQVGAPFVQYTRDDPDVVFVPQDSPEKPAVEPRAVARKSTRTMIPQVAVGSLNKRSVVAASSFGGAPGKIVFYTPRKQKPSMKTFQMHDCTIQCQKLMHTTLSKLRGYSPLAKPLLCGFDRIFYKMKNRKPIIMYKTPCGRSARNMDELHTYLRLTQSDLTVDLFSFDPVVRCLAEFILENNNPLVKDLSNGLEEVQIPLVNYVDVEINDFVNYSTKRMPMAGVNLNLDPEFLSGCDCVDDCMDKSKCSCWQLTLQGAAYLNKNIDEIGYKHRRLLDPVLTGIFECNSRCKCAKTCLNRVVQNPLQHKLQVFKTLKRGWGIRCINDIPQGAFICIYAGSLLTDQMANESGKRYGDEYYAELDYIETVETAKEGYEEEPYESDEVENPTPVNNQSSRFGPTPDKEYVPESRIGNNIGTDIKDRLRKRDDKSKDYGSDEENAYREPSSFTPADDEISDTSEHSSAYTSVRTIFGKKERVYIMDAKTTGNIGRYLNHSCEPNVFVQNVFVDTHDLRFPWVSFFALDYIRAGTELTWNYNYDIGSVQDKELQCHCGTAHCRGRLL